MRALAEGALAVPRSGERRQARVGRKIYRTTGGLVVPGVTTLIGQLDRPALRDWAFRLAREHPEVESLRDYMGDAGTRGSLAHHLIESRLLSEEPDLDDFTPSEVAQARLSLEIFDEWLAGKDLRIIEIEGEVVSDTYRVGGTFDIFAEVNGRRVVIDLKTSAGIYLEHVLQVVGYAELLRDAGERVDEVRVVRVGRIDDLGVTERVLREWGQHWGVILALRDLHEARRGLR